jgi:hypothetical protein
MQGCTCPDYGRSASVCKHMLLVNKVHRILLPLPDSLPLPTGVTGGSSAAPVSQQVDPVEALQETIQR